MTPEGKRRGRVSLSEKQQQTQAGSALLELLNEITDDGNITDEEIEKLRLWLKTTNGDLPGIAHLREEVGAIVADGRIDQAERTALQREIERVLPPDWRYDAVTQREAFEATLISNRQKMVLRFWGKEPDPAWDRRAVSRWMDEWYAENPLRLYAWEAFKRKTGDRGWQGDPMRVPWNVGPKYLEEEQSKISGEETADAATERLTEASSKPRQPAPRESNLGIIILVLLAFVAVAVISARL